MEPPTMRPLRHRFFPPKPGADDRERLRRALLDDVEARIERAKEAVERSAALHAEAHRELSRAYTVMAQLRGL